MKVSIPDDLVDTLEAVNPTLKIVSPTGTASTAFLNFLRRMVNVPVNAPVLIVHGADYDRLHELLGVGALRDTPAFTAAVERLYAVKIEGVDIPFTPGEREELQRRSERSGKPVAELIAEVVRGMHEQFFSQALGV
jgi:hypothetical protein